MPQGHPVSLPGDLAGAGAVSDGDTVLGGSFLLHRPKVGSPRQVGADKIVGGKREVDRARTTSASPPKFQGHFILGVLFLEDLN